MEMDVIAPMALISWTIKHITFDYIVSTICFNQMQFAIDILWKHWAERCIDLLWNIMMLIDNAVAWAKALLSH